MLFVSHDMGLIAEVCDDVVVMYAGQIVERASTLDLFDRPRHPYTEGLLRSVPGNVPRGTELYGIPGSMPVAGNMPAGCRFHPRCPHVIDTCSLSPLALESISGGQEVRCLRARDISLKGVAA
jgi:oligopeptide/dipeptide ABC transporter ATP-binding protein